MMKYFFLSLFVLAGTILRAQTSYTDSIQNFIANYINSHEVVKGKDREKLRFYAPDKTFQTVANFTSAQNADWISFKTSGSLNKVFRLYGTLTFLLKNKAYQLQIYQSKSLLDNPQYKNYLFLPFLDSTSGKETYPSGRYIDITTDDIVNGKVIIDFNKAYNPYCAYVSGVYNCPIPPKENFLTIAVRAGEKVYANKH